MLNANFRAWLTCHLHRFGQQVGYPIWAVRQIPVNPQGYLHQPVDGQVTVIHAADSFIGELAAKHVKDYLLSPT